jgi:hypothetical protein
MCRFVSVLSISPAPFIYVWHTSVAASLGPDLASRATSSNNDEVDATSVDGVVVSSVVGVDLRLIH